MRINFVINNSPTPGINEISETMTFRDLIIALETQLNQQHNQHIIEVQDRDVNYFLGKYGNETVGTRVENGGSIRFTTQLINVLPPQPPQPPLPPPPQQITQRSITLVINGSQQTPFTVPDNMLFRDFVIGIAGGLTQGTLITKMHNKDINELFQSYGATPLSIIFPKDSPTVLLPLEVVVQGALPVAPVPVLPIGVKRKIIWDIHGAYDVEGKKDFNFPFHSLKFYCPNNISLFANCDTDSMTAVNNDSVNLILEKIPDPRRVGIPGAEGKISLRNMSFSMETSDKYNNCYASMGVWICEPGGTCMNPQDRYITWGELFDPVSGGLPPFYKMAKSTSRGRKPIYYFDDIFKLSEYVVRSITSLDQNLKNYEICMITCRPNTRDPKHAIPDGNDPNKSYYMQGPSYDRRHIQSYAGGSDSLIIQKLLQETKDKQKNKLENKPLVLNVSEEQMHFYLTSPEEPTMEQVVDSLTENEISEQLQLHPELLKKIKTNRGGKKTKQHKTTRAIKKEIKNKKYKNKTKYNR